MNVSKIELVYNPNQDHQLYTPVILTASLLAKDSQLITIKSSENKVQNSSSSVDLVIDSKPLNQQLKPFSVCQLLIQLVNKPTDLYSSGDALKIHHFVDLVESKQDLNDLITSLSNQLVNQKYLAGSNLTLADLFIWSRFAYQDGDKIDAVDRTKKWFRRIENDLKSAIHLLALYKPKIVKDAPKQAKQPKEKKASKGPINEEAKYVDLKDAKDGEVVVRFPPEASGYLHIGHAKAALLNQFYQVKFNGKLIFRFDDTNPEKEKEDFEKVIREDVEMLQIKPDICSYTSDYFDLYLEKCEYLITQGKAYVDDTPPEQMKQERDERIPSKNRDNSVEKNLKMWEEMKKGTEEGQKCCVRAKIDMKSNNGCLRDPALYRCKNTPHPRTGDKYKVYPTYDFACPIIDSIEGVTHSLRTTEYLDRDPQFNWIIDALNLRKVNIADYSRLNMQHVVLSKRKLTWFVQNNIVSGWDDPRMPTVRGILRRGLTVDGLREFIVAQGSSRSIVFMEWDKIWNFNRKIIDPKAVRYMGIEKLNSVKVNVDNLNVSEIEVDCNPKNPDLKKRKMKVNKQLLIDQIDAAEIKENEFVTFMNLGNIFINKVIKENGLVKEVNGKFDPNNKDFKKTLKVTWLDSTNVIDAHCYYYENLIEKPVLDKDDEFKDYINKESEIKVDFLVEKEMVNLKKSDIIQVLRKGYFICDQPYDPKALTHTSLDGKITLFSIPDGTTDLACYPSVVKDAKLRLKEKIKQFAEKKPTSKASTNQPSSADDLIARHEEQAATVRRLKEEAKTNKNIDVKQEVAKLLAIKKEYKELTGNDIPATSAQPKSKPQQPQQSSPADDLIARHEEQAATVRRLKEEAKTNKSINVKPEVDKLLAIKKEYKELTGTDIPATSAQPKSKPQQQQPQKQPQQQSSSADDLILKHEEQAATVRRLKEEAKTNKSINVKPEVDKLLAIKKEYKELTGTDIPATSAQPKSKPQQQQPQKQSSPADDLIARHEEQAATVRRLKEEAKTNKSINVKPEVDKLLAIKKEYKELTGNDIPATTAQPKSKPQPQPQQQQSKPKEAKPKQQQPAAESSQVKKKQTKLGMENKKSENFSEWYTEVITKSEMIDYYDISGCYVLWEWSFSIWEKITEYLNNKIKEEGVKNVGFPLFVSKNSLEVEEDHISDFAPEVAWVTKSGKSDLQEPIAIRPTSETVMYPYFAKRIKSHRDLPLKVNQWCNVVRWEFKDPTPFLRTREFYWQEGHTAHATSEEALREVYKILDHYASVYEYLLAIPVIKGKKTNKEKFAGGDMTTTIEGYISENGRGIQAATSHYLGQNFAKMFKIGFQDERSSKDRQLVYQNSWGFTTRSIGVMIMEHSDDRGLVLPPRVSPIQVVIIPCGIKTDTTSENKEKLLNAAKKLEEDLLDANIKVELDSSDHQTVGWKFNHYELKGVPVRIEIGFNDLSKNECVAIRRDTLEKKTIALAESKELVNKLLNDIQNDLFKSAKTKRDAKLRLVKSMEEFNQHLNDKCLILAAFCGDDQCEETIKKDTVSQDAQGSAIMGAKSLCIPFKPEELFSDIKDLDANSKCINSKCNLKPQFYTLFGRSY